MKLHVSAALAICMCFAGMLPAQVGAPKLGILRYADGAVRPIYGLEANLIVGKQMFRTADAVSFSESGGLVAVNGHVRLLGHKGFVLSEYNARDRKPVLDVARDLTTAIAYLPSCEALLRWNGRSFVLIPLEAGSFEGTVTSIQAQGSRAAKLLVTGRNQDVSEIIVSLETGQLIALKPLPGIRGPAFLDQGFVIFRDEHGLEIEAANGNRRTIPLLAADLANDLKCERMSQEWLHISFRSTKQDWVLHLNGAAIDLSELPVAPAPGGGK